MKRTIPPFYIAVFFVFLFGAVLCGCSSTKYVEVEKVRRDSVYLTSLRCDTLFSRDSVYIREKGDTVLVDKYHIVYRSRLLVDTMYVDRVDSVQVPYPVEAKITKWQRILIGSGRLFLVLLGVGVISLAVYIIIKTRNSR
jgi:hypothetical protein